MPEDPSADRNVDLTVAELLRAVMASPPSKSDIALLPSWVQVIGKIMTAYSACDPKTCGGEIRLVWKAVFPFLESDDGATRRESAETLVVLTQCLTNEMIDVAVENADPVSPIPPMITQLTKAMDSLAYARVIPELFFVLSALITRMRHRPTSASPEASSARPVTAAERKLLPIIEKVANMRVTKGFEYKDPADGVLRTAMSVIGPETLLQRLPLNLEPEDR